MRKIILPSAFSLLELLIVMALVIGLASYLLRQHQNSPDKKMSGALEESMRQEIEHLNPGDISEFNPGKIGGKNSNGPFSFEFVGTHPNGQIVKRNKDGEFTIQERVVTFRLTALNKEGRFLKDTPSESELPEIKKIQVDLSLYSEKEDPNYYINDRVRGIDVDGDPSNGLAHVTTRTFGLILKR